MTDESVPVLSTDPCEVCDGSGRDNCIACHGWGVVGLHRLCPECGTDPDWPYSFVVSRRDYEKLLAERAASAARIAELEGALRHTIAHSFTETCPWCRAARAALAATEPRPETPRKGNPYGFPSGDDPR